jgi:23S rRNA (uracil747-C5)-methyltransferase
LICEHFLAERCQSCDRIELPYGEQIAQKNKRLRELLADFSIEQWLPFVTSEQFGFRNKAKMVVMGSAHAPILGLVGPHGDEVSLEDCPLYSPSMTQCLLALTKYIQKAGIPPYNVRKKKGELKYLLLTESRSNDQIMLRFVLRSEQVLDRIKAILPELQNAFPNVVAISANIQPVHMAILEGEQEIYLTEQTSITQTLNGIPLSIRAKSFFQTNPDLAGILYEQVANWAAELGAKSIWDLFCGVGGLGLHCLRDGVNLTGIEIEPNAIESAHASARAIGRSEQVQFAAFDASLLAKQSNELPDLVIVNPPRRGIGAELCQMFKTSSVKHLIYSSCNALTLQADLKRLDNYRICRVQGFDFFPNTRHFEVLVMLERLTA